MEFHGVSCMYVCRDYVKLKFFWNRITDTFLYSK